MLCALDERLILLSGIRTSIVVLENHWVQLAFTDQQGGGGTKTCFSQHESKTGRVGGGGCFREG